MTNIASSAISNRQAAASSGNSPETSAHKKLRKAAQEFEGILISQLWGEFKSSLSSIEGDTPMAGSDTLNSLAIQTLSRPWPAAEGWESRKCWFTNSSPA